MTNILYILLAILLLGVIVVVHEFGHFIVGRLSGIGVVEFSVGFGPRLLRWRRGETDYSLRAIPVGGFCKFVGEDEENPAPDAMNNAPVWKRICTVAAGPAMNFVLAYVAAVASRSLDDIFALAAERGEAPFIVLLDGVTDPHNLGAIIRSAECAGAHGVVLPERRAAGLGPAAAKAAAGALECIPIARVKNLNRAIDELKARGVWVVGSAMNGENALKADLSGAVALVVGSEGDGISRLTLEKCDRVVTLPMSGRIESLNASVAAGILMYEIVRARKG